MLELQYFKSQVVLTVLDRLLRSSVPEPGLFTIALNNESKRPTDCEHMPLPEASMADKKLFYDLARAVVNENPVFATCVVRPQWSINYRLGGPQTERITAYHSELFDGEGQWLPAISNAMHDADDNDVLINRCLTFCFEYPVAYEQKERPRAWEQIKREQISGCTLVQINLIPHANGLGGWQTVPGRMSQERGSEYGDLLPAHLFGRNIRGKPVEETPYAGKIPWYIGSNHAISILTGAAVYVALPDVSRFPTPPMSTESDSDDYDYEEI